MDTFNRRLLFGVLLILAGVAFLLDNLGVFRVQGIIWGVLFALGGLAFLSVLYKNRAQWWAAIPGIILLDLGALIILSDLFPGSSDRFGGPLFLAGIGLAFVVVYLLNPTFWWAVIPAGTMITLALVAGLDQIPGIDGGAILFLGLGVTFALLAVLPVQPNRLSWAWIPAVVLFALGLVILASATSLVNYVWPLALIALGAFLLLRGYLRKS